MKNILHRKVALSKRARLFLFHALISSLFLIVPILVSTRPPGEPFLTITRPFIRDILGGVFLLGFFYLSYYYLIPRFYFTRKFIPFVLWSMLLFLLIILLPSLLTGRLLERVDGPPVGPFPSGSGEEPPGFTVGQFLYNELRHHLYLFVIVLVFSVLLRTRKQAREETQLSLTQNEGARYLVLKTDQGMMKTELEDIIYIEGLGNYLRVNLAGNRCVVVRLTMKAIMEQLPENAFLRVHRSYIVAMAKVEVVGRKILIVSGGKEIPIGKNYESIVSGTGLLDAPENGSSGS